MPAPAAPSPAAPSPAVEAVDAVDAVVFDVLGTLVDQTAGIRSAIVDAAPSSDGATVDGLLSLWQRHVGHEQQRILDGRRPYAPSHVLDAEAAALVVERTGLSDPATDPATVARLATANQRLEPWPDTCAGLAALAEHHLLIGLSNASSRALVRLDAHAGLRWHLALSTEAVSAYKPAAAAYRLALDAVDRPPERVLMVATHAWDLRGARAVGMRTAHVTRPRGEPPAPDDHVDLRARDLADLATQLGSS